MKTKQQQQPKDKYVFQKYSDKFRTIFQKSAVKIAEETPHIEQQIPYHPIQHHAKKQYFFYRVKSIGVGAHSFVHLVQQQETRALYAQKSVVKTHAKQHQQQLTNEIKILLHIEHDNLIKLYHFYTDDSYVHMIMQFAEDSLFALKQKFVFFKEKEVLEILKQLLKGVRYLHDKNIVHADIKLENIMIANGTVKLCDFGYAHHKKPLLPQNKENLANNDKETEKNIQVVGTLEYLSPQYAMGRDSGWKRDIWAIGILAFQLFVGKNPFQDLKQNQKWSKLVKHPAKLYLQDLKAHQKQIGIISQKIEDFICKTLCDESQRWPARNLLQTPYFS